MSPDPGAAAARAGRTRRYCAFVVDGLLVGIEVHWVAEVIRPQPMTPVPHAGAGVRGLINLRGQIVTAVDLRHRLGLPAASADAPQRHVVVRVGDEAVSLLVDEARDVVEVDEESFELVPATVCPATRRYLVGAYQLSEGLLLVLDTEAVVAADDEPAAVGAASGRWPA